MFPVFVFAFFVFLVLYFVDGKMEFVPIYILLTIIIGLLYCIAESVNPQNGKEK